jgi:hypothetical protein
LLSLAGLGVGWLVVKTSTVYALADLNPYAVSKVAPDDPRVAMNIAYYEFLLRNGAVSDRARRRAYEALAGAPLAETPMLLAAVDALAAGDTRRGEALLVEARRREPRSRPVRLLLLDRYLRANRVSEAGEEIAVLVRLLPEAGELLVPQLAKMAADPKTGPQLMRVLDRNANLQQDVLARLAGSAPPQVVLEAASQVKSAGEAAPQWQSVLLSRIVAGNDIVQAYGLWKQFTGAGGGDAEKNVYDASFRGLRGAPPFNWQLASGAEGVAERAAGGGLQVQYFGRNPVELASQILLLRPGSYKLQIDAEGSASGEGARLIWSVACAGASGHLIDLPLVKVISAPRRFAGAFTIPAGCSAQWLRLSGTPAEFPTEQDAVMKEVRIERAGA